MVAVFQQWQFSYVTLFWVTLLIRISGGSPQYPLLEPNNKETFQIRVPIALKLHQSRSSTDSMLIENLICRTQRLIDAELSTLKFTPGVHYSITLHSYDHYSSCGLHGYEIQLLHSTQESFHISPFDDKEITVFQTDLLIAKNVMPVFIKDVILNHLLKWEILSYVEAVAIPANETNKGQNRKKTCSSTAGGIGCSFEESLKDIKALVPPLILTSNNYDVKVSVWYSDVNQFDYWLFQDLIQEGLVSFLKDYVQLDIEVEYRQSDGTNITSFQQTLNNEVLQIDLLLDQDSEEERVLSFPQKGGLQVVKAQDPIHVMELLSAQILQLIGISSYSIYPEPKSPFIRLDFLIRRQLGINWRKLIQKDNRIENLIYETRFNEALQKSWQLLQEY